MSLLWSFVKRPAVYVTVAEVEDVGCINAFRATQDG